MSTPPPDRGATPEPESSAGQGTRPPAPTGFFNSHWFASRTVRHATHMRKHVWKLLCAQRDLLAPPAIQAIQESLDQLESICHSTHDRKTVEAGMSHLETVANKWLRPYPGAAIRENVEVLLVAIAIAMAIRTFVAQPFKIPTGSMQPTLYGVTSVPDYTKFQETPPADFPIPGAVSRFFQFWWSGVGYDHVVAKAPGRMQAAVDQPQKFLLFNLKQVFRVGDETYTVWFPPDNLLRRSGLIDPYGRPTDREFKAGDTLLKLKSFSGDHLFVDRISYNFRRPRRGEIIVFETKDIPEMPRDQQGQFYIKRLVGLGGEKIQIGDDRHLVINGQRLDHKTPHFERIYSFDPAKPPMESAFSGHVNNRGYLGLAPLFPDGKSVFEVPANHYIVMGDNTLNSSDSRRWGAFAQENVIGKSWLVYWPIGQQDDREKRFGWSNH